jgi:hypothetical protein
VIERQKHRAIEIHDSVIDALSLDNGDAVLHFSHLYIHETEGVPGIDAGTGWSQEGNLKINDAVVEGSFSEWPADLHEGQIAVDGTLYENEIPISLDVVGKIELRLQSWSDVIFIIGKGAKLELVGEATYLEEFPGAG